MSESTSEILNNMSDKTTNTMYMMFVGFILIIFAYGTGVRNNKFFFLLMKVGIVILYLYVFTIVYKSLKNIFNINGLFTSPSLKSLKFFFLLFTIFEMCLVLLVAYILYSVFF
jgi:hypothetical protein